MKQTFLFTFLLCLITLSCETDSYTEYTVSADAPNTKSTISSDDAVAQVKEFLSGWNVNTRGDMVEREIGAVYAWRTNEIFPSSSFTRNTTSTQLPDTLLYIVNFENEEGFALVSADADRPDIVAFIEHGSLAPGQEIENPGFQLFLNGYAKYSRFQPFEPIRPRPGTEPQLVWRFDMHIPPMLTTQWSQGAPYNKFCFTPSGNHASAGCIPVALGQIVAYHQFPTSYDGHVYDWDSILQDSTVSVYDVSASNSVGHLIHDIGILVNTYYGEGGSESYEWTVPNMWNSFGYHYQSSSSCDFDSLRVNLARNNPVCMFGFGIVDGFTIGHAWVIDGIAIRSQYNLSEYINDPILPFFPHPIEQSYNLVHCNWGWGGLDDGYFIYEALNQKFDTSTNTISEFEVNFYDIHRVHWQIHPETDN